MPKRLPKPCAYPGCPELTEGRYCEKHAREDDRARGTATQRGYDERWRKARTFYLKRHPLCVGCVDEGRITPATVVDHIIPHKGNKELFWDESNWQALCASCHSRKTMKETKGIKNDDDKRSESV